MSFAFVSHGRRPVASRFPAVGGCALLVWEFADGEWCYLDQLWCRQWRHKQGAVVALWWDGE